MVDIDTMRRGHNSPPGFIVPRRKTIWTALALVKPATPSPGAIALHFAGHMT
jgi:hypothetical protein